MTHFFISFSFRQNDRSPQTKNNSIRYNIFYCSKGLLPCFQTSKGFLLHCSSYLQWKILAREWGRKWQIRGVGRGVFSIAGTLPCKVGVILFNQKIKARLLILPMCFSFIKPFLLFPLQIQPSQYNLVLFLSSRIFNIAGL